MSGSLTPADREWGMEHALGHFENDWIRTIARAEASDDDAIMTVRSRLHYGGFLGDEGRWDTDYDHGIRIQRFGRAGFVSWRELVRFARATAHQAAFPLAVLGGTETDE